MLYVSLSPMVEYGEANRNILHILLLQGKPKHRHVHIFDFKETVEFLLL